jgi:hypothetical protein
MKAVLPGIGATVVNPTKGKPKNSINVNNLHTIWVSVEKLVQG